MIIQYISIGEDLRKSFTRHHRTFQDISKQNTAKQNSTFQILTYAYANILSNSIKHENI